MVKTLGYLSRNIELQNTVVLTYMRRLSSANGAKHEVGEDLHPSDDVGYLPIFDGCL